MSQPTLSNPYEAPRTSPQQPSSRLTFLGHPAGLMILFFVEMWERFSYYGMRAMLILYLTAKTDILNPGRGWSESEAGTLYGWYTGMAYLLPLVGGLIADRIIGNNRSMIIGGVIISLGHIVLAISGMGEMELSHQGMSLFITGLVLIVIGTGHFKPCVSSMVGQLYDDKDPRRDGAFTIFYMGINLGAALGPICCGILASKFGWHWGFGAAAVGMILGLILYLFTREQFLGRIGHRATDAGLLATWVWVPLSCGVAVIFGLLHYYGFFGELSSWLESMKQAYPLILPIFSISMLSVMLVLATLFTLQQLPEDRGPVASIFILMVLNAFFWLAFEQAGSSMNLFTESSVDRVLWETDLPPSPELPQGGKSITEVPASAFQSVNPVFILMFGPVLSWLWTTLGRSGRNPSQGMKLAIGLGLLGLGFLVLVLATRGLNVPGAKTGMGVLILCYFLHTIGELCISPTGLSYVTKASPVRFLSLLMGMWFISNFVANLVGGLIAGKVKAIEKGEFQLPWSLGGQADFFMLFVVSSLGAAAVALVLTPLLKKLARK